MASGSPPQPRGNAIDQLHQPGSFLWLYISVSAICAMSIAVKVLTVVMKKRRDKKRDPDLERQQLEPFQKWWYPWRYDDKGRKMKSEIDNGTSSGAGECSAASSKTLVADAAPQLPPPAHHRDSALDRVVYRTGSRAADNAADSPALMSGALSPNSLPSPIQLSSLDSRLDRARVSSTASLLSSSRGQDDDPRATASASLASDSDSNSSRSRLPPVNPFTSRPFRSAIPRATGGGSSSSTWAPRTRPEANAVGSGYGGLSLPSVYPNRANSDNPSSEEGQFGRSLTHNAQPLISPAPKQSGVDAGRDFAHGYGSSSTTKPGKETPQPSADSSNSGAPPSRLPRSSSPRRATPAAGAADSSRQVLSSSSSFSSHAPNPPPTRRGMGSGKFRNVVREDKWSRELREKEAEAMKKKEEEEVAKQKRKKQQHEGERGAGKKTTKDKNTK